MEENRKRNVQMKFRVDREEYDFIVEKAKASGKRNLTQYLRSMAIAGQTIHIELDDIKILQPVLVALLQAQTRLPRELMRLEMFMMRTSRKSKVWREKYGEN